MTRKVVLAGSTILAMIEGLSRMRTIPEKEWLAPIIDELERIYREPGDKVTLERMGK